MIKTLNKELTLDRKLERPLAILIFSALTFCASLIRIHVPFTPVPFTMQTFVIFMAAYYLKSREAGIAQSLYIMAGLVGAPVFAAGIAGTVALIGPTAGYLAGFIVVGALLPPALERAGKLTYFKAFFIFSGGAVLILLFGTMHLAFGYKMGLKEAFSAGFMPFAAGEAVKAAFAASLFGLKK